MPMYDYRCKNCDEIYEELVFSSDTRDKEIRCPKCGETKSERLLSAPTISTGSASKSNGTSTNRGCGLSGFG